MRLTFIGQSGFVVEDGWRIVIDPFLGELEDASERRRFPRLCQPPMSAEQLSNVDLALISHHHGDHCHRPTLSALATAAPHCTFVVTPSTRDQLLEAGIDPSRLLVPEFPGWRTIGPVTFCVLPAAHPTFSQRPDAVFDYFGFVLKTSAGHLYSAGDTVPYNGLTNLIRALGVKIALLPVNGRDEHREKLGIVGNMDASESSLLAKDGGVEWIVPCHFGMFAANTVDIDSVEAILRRDNPGAGIWSPTIGESRTFE